ncbi:DNA recombination protein RmuC [Aequorivita vladivostokensis]|uniref:DNA polymerase V n=1 Tax=Aequorivita vladivostokensis TaxID=171194 RepID=A0ABR5DKX0_9FLAO|nr:DNA recombination protein RmuC [Aequorivita vladivostokensis]KJJ39426.1 DNA polymerase V [Aequorivita vladivostokensis]MAB56320.1 DNA recombination protein RmuC [Aequorivita sp.]MBF31390.1 DNA recombination protein RmuC [Aequorivita sp.]
MNETFLFLLLAAICLLIGAFLGNYFARLKGKTETSKLEERLENAQLQSEKLNERFETALREKEEIRLEKEQINMLLTRRNSEFENLENRNREQKAEVEKLQEKFTKEFENLANKILDEKSTKFSKQNKESLEIILNPLQEKIKNFEKRVEDTHKESIDRHAMLRQQIIGLKELNEQMSKEATNLTKALKGDSKIQGNWGELVLERVLEKSGLEKDREYFVQNSFTTDEGRRVLPDVVLHLPDNKKMIIDSKVSLVAYERFVNEEDEDQRARFLKEHVTSLKKHIEQLSGKNYHTLYEIESPDFVLLFVPIEPAFAVAINRDNNIYNWAFEKNIVIVTPSTLLATLRTVDSMWTNEKQQQNAIEIATQAGRLYDQFVNLTEDLIKVGNQLNTVKGSYDSTMVKLTGKGNLISKVERLKKLGSKASKQVNEKLLKKAEENFDNQ